jgi:hypothetical protein
MRKENMRKKSSKEISLEMINRIAAVIRPKAPFLAWIHSIPDMEMEDFTLDKLRSGEQTVFLLPEFFSLDEAGVYVDRIYKTIFETELAGWWTDPKDWPQKMTIKMFHGWFDVELHSTVFDTTGDDFLTMEHL